MQVNNATKNAYKSGRGQNSLRIYFPDLDLTVPAKSIVKESMTLKEAVSDSENIEFVGCIASQFQIRLHGISDDLKNKKVQVYITSGNTQEIALFTGIVDSAQMESNKNYKAISAFDELYTAGQSDIADWYNGLAFPMTIRSFRDRMFEHLGITQVATSLPNDNIIIEKQYSPSSLQALPVIKSVCQINGMFGIINRDGLFEYRRPASGTATETLSPYKTIDYQEYTVKPVDRLTIRQTDQEEGVSYGDGDNTYIIQGNFFTLNLEEETLTTMAANVYAVVSGFSYMPFESKNVALPWAECGSDVISCDVYDFENSTSGSAVYKQMSFCVLARTMTGIQALRDSFSAQGDELQRVFITDIKSQVETIVEQVQQISGRLEDFSMNYVYFVNTGKVEIGDGDTVSVGGIRFVARKATQVLVHMEYLLECETTVDGINYHDLVAQVLYYYDEELVTTRKPVETYADGEHILHLFYPIYVQDASEHDLEIRIKAVGGSITIQPAQAINMICGQSLVESNWDGKIKIEQEAAISVIGGHLVNVHGVPFGEDIDIAMQEPIPITPSDNVSIIDLGPIQELTTYGIEDAVQIEFTEVEE